MSSPYPGFNFGTQSPQLPTQPKPTSQPQHPDPWAMILQLMTQPQAPQHQGTDLSGLLTQLRNDPQGDANKAYIPGQQGPGNPFSNGFFKTAEQRKQIETDRLGTPGFSSQTPQAQQAALGTHQPVPGANVMNAAGASPLPFQLDPSTLAMIHGQPNPATTSSDLAQHNDWGNLFAQSNQPKPKKKPQAPALGGSPSPGFNFGGMFQ